MEQVVPLCEYGCGQPAKYRFANGKYCCSKSKNSCPVSRKKNGLGNKGRHHSKETKKLLEFNGISKVG